MNSPEILAKVAGFGGGSGAGQIVETKKGILGRTYSSKKFINGKIIVYTLGGKLLCDPSGLTLKGFID